MSKSKAITALKIMCRRCRNYEVCQGTGCGPKKILEQEITKKEKMIHEEIIY